MGTYADSLLSEGEHVIRRERQHWLALLLDSRAAIALWIVALLILAAIIIPNIQGTGRSILSYVLLGALIIGLVIFAFRWWQWRTEEYLVTSRRLLKVSGIINKQSGDSSLEKINDAVLFENLLGRLLNYGDLDILTAAEVAVDRYRMLNRAKTFKIDMLNAKHALEHEVAYVEMPSPPLKADATGATVPLPAASSTLDTAVVASTVIPVAAGAGRDVVAPISTPQAAPSAPAPAAAAAAPTVEAAAVAAEAAPPAVDSAPATDAPPAMMADAPPAMMADAPPAMMADAPPAVVAPPVAAEEPATEPAAALAASPTTDDAIDTPDEVMEALTRLADLRDHGTITPEEYEAKKQELLGRL